MPARPGEAGTAPVPLAEPPAIPPFRASIQPLTQEDREAMTGVSWRPGCPVSLDRLVRITLLHHDFEGGVREGTLIVRDEVAPVVVRAFEAAYEEGFPIERIEPVWRYGGSDERSMDANNTSAFNCRPVTGGTRFSEHSFGHAIDVNPVQNPYVSSSGRTVLPPAGRAYVDRERVRPGMLTDGSAMVRVFRESGWGWGGHWSRSRDYQHLSVTGR